MKNFANQEKSSATVSQMEGVFLMNFIETINILMQQTRKGHTILISELFRVIRCCD